MELDDFKYDPEYLLKYRKNIIEMKKTVAKHTRSLLKSVQTTAGQSSEAKLKQGIELERIEGFLDSHLTAIRDKKENEELELLAKKA